MLEVIDSVVTLCAVAVVALLLLPFIVAYIVVGLVAGMVVVLYTFAKKVWSKIQRVRPQHRPSQPHRHSVWGSWRPHHVVHNK